MSKYIIDLDYDLQRVVGVGVKQGTVWVKDYDVDDLEELCADYINENFGDLQDEAYRRGVNDGSIDVKERVDCAYQRGLDDAWEAAKKIALMDTETSENVTGYFGLFRIMENLTPMQAIEKLKAYEEQKADDEIKVGDEVRSTYGGRVMEDFTPWVVTLVTSETCYGFDVDGNPRNNPNTMVQKTGRHFDIESVLEEMKE